MDEYARAFLTAGAHRTLRVDCVSPNSQDGNKTSMFVFLYPIWKYFFQNQRSVTESLRWLRTYNIMIEL